MFEVAEIRLKDIEPNTGQVEGLPKNPRTIRGAKFEKLKKDLVAHPEMLDIRRLMVYPLGSKFIVIGGNMRYRALKSLGIDTAPCVVLPSGTPPEKLRAYSVLDNGGFGDWDFDALANEWDAFELTEWGVDLPVYDDGGADDGTAEDAAGADEEDDDGEEVDTSIGSVSDVLYDSDNDFEIPSLLAEMQAGRLELPFTPWGANSRLRKDVATYHFYVDDYRFEKLWKDPVALVNSGCKAMAEPNCSLHDQTPVAYGLHLIYKKRWLSRYMQELGVKVYADLNVADKFREYNKLGIPEGYDAFMTRGLTGQVGALRRDLEDARSISGKERPNLICYGGGTDIVDFCKKNAILYVKDFVNDK